MTYIITCYFVRLLTNPTKPMPESFTNGFYSSNIGANQRFVIEISSFLRFTEASD